MDGDLGQLLPRLVQKLLQPGNLTLRIHGATAITLVWMPLFGRMGCLAPMDR